MEESFARVEIKYMLSLSQAAFMEDGLSGRGFVKMDFGCPRVQSLYFDTGDHALIRASLERPAYKEKLRLRAYGEPGRITQSFVEIKKKFNGVVYKRRAALSLREAQLGLPAGLLPQETGQVGREAQWLVNHYDLRPAAVIAYDRDAWFSQTEKDVRITFDRNLSFRDWDTDLNEPAENLPLIAPEMRLMEIKTGGTYPLWLARLLEGIGAKRVHFSKYGLAYQKYILPGKSGMKEDETKCLKVSLSKGA